MKPNQLIKKLEEIVKICGDSEPVKEFQEKIIKYLSPKTPSYERSWEGMAGEIIDITNATSHKYDDTFLSILEDLQKWEELLGYRANIRTLQEHRLIGSSGSFRDINPYTPLCLLKNPNMTLDEVRKARELERFSRAFLSCYIIPNYHQTDPSVVRVLLEPLDENGRTIRDPRPVDEYLNVITNFSKSDNFPYKRGD